MSVSPINTEKSKLFSALSNVLRHKPMRPVVRLFTQLHVVLYRLTNGKAQIAKYPTLLLTVRGRKTGKPRTIPLIYIPDGKRFIIAAAYSGSDQNPTWWLNLQQSGEALVQMMGLKVRSALCWPHRASDSLFGRDLWRCIRISPSIKNEPNAKYQWSFLNRLKSSQLAPHHEDSCSINLIEWRKIRNRPLNICCGGVGLISGVPASFR